MSQFNHDHIIKLIGICKDTPCLLVIELAEYGQLKSYLKANVNKLELDLLILYCYQICKALVYLENKNYVHRDIAARNILLCNKEYVKLSDFGLTRYIDEIYQETESQLKLPVKWLAIESLCFRIFTSKSDVWMFSVCMWEIFEFGDKPYQNFKNKDMIKVLESGERLNKPDYCPNELYSLMLECWNYQPNERPNFSLIEKTLKILYNKYQTQKTKEKPFKSNLRSSDESDHEDEKWLEESFKEISINQEEQIKYLSKSKQQRDFLLRNYTFRFVKEISKLVNQYSHEQIEIVAISWKNLSLIYRESIKYISKPDVMTKLINQMNDKIISLIIELKTLTFNASHANYIVELARKTKDILEILTTMPSTQ